MDVRRFSLKKTYGKNCPHTFLSRLFHKKSLHSTDEKHQGDFMQVDIRKDNSTLTLKLEGRLDTLSAPELDAGLKNSLEGIELLILDFSRLQYVSSAGLRVILSAQKQMTARNGKMIVRDVNPGVLDILEMTGFAGILTIETTR